MPGPIRSGYRPVLEAEEAFPFYTRTSFDHLARRLGFQVASAGGPVVDAVLLNEAPIDEETRERYRAEGAAPLSWPERGYRGVLTVRRNLLAAGRPFRHDPAATAEGLTAAWEAVTSRAKANRFGA